MERILGTEERVEEIRRVLEGQLNIAWQLLEYHLGDLTQEECLWRPAQAGLHVFQEAGAWRAEWPESESYSTGPPSIAWLTWHIGFWWSMVLNHSFGDGSLRRDSIMWPGEIEETRQWIAQLHKEWVEAVSALSDDELKSVTLSRWPFSDRPYVEVVAWLNVELMKNAAEIGYCRFLYGVRREA